MSDTTRHRWIPSVTVGGLAEGTVDWITGEPPLKVSTVAARTCVDC